MSTEEGEVATEEVPKLTEEKPAEEKKAKVPKSPKDKKRTGSKPSASSHPPYFQMIKEAIVALNEKTGSSPYAIAKFMEEKHEGVLPQNSKKVLAVQLRNFTAKGKLVKVKASFKLSEAGKNGERRRWTGRSSSSSLNGSRGSQGRLPRGKLLQVPGRRQRRPLLRSRSSPSRSGPQRRRRRERPLLDGAEGSALRLCSCSVYRMCP